MVTSKILCLLIVCGVASAGIAPSSQADILSYLMSNPPMAPQVDRQGSTVRDERKPTSSQQEMDYRLSRPQQRTTLITPGNVQTAHRRPVQHVVRASETTSAAALARPVVSRAKASDVRQASAPQVNSRRTRVAMREKTRVHQDLSYQQNRAFRAQQATAPPYPQQTQAGYASAYPQQPTYAASPRYYQGYAYQGSNQTDPTSCGPGRV